MFSVQDKSRGCHGLWCFTSLLWTVLRGPGKGLCRDVCGLHGFNHWGKYTNLKRCIFSPGCNLKFNVAFPSRSITVHLACQPSTSQTTSVLCAVSPSLSMSVRKGSLRTHIDYLATMCILPVTFTDTFSCL